MDFQLGLPVSGLCPEGLYAECQVVRGLSKQLNFLFTEGIGLRRADANRGKNIAVDPQRERQHRGDSTPGLNFVPWRCPRGSRLQARNARLASANRDVRWTFVAPMGDPRLFERLDVGFVEPGMGDEAGRIRRIVLTSVDPCEAVTGAFNHYPADLLE
ncbi:hypothetical protein D9M68_524880 [compost metagenome]